MTRDRFKRVWPPVALFALTLLFVGWEPAPSRDPFVAVSPTALWLSVHASPASRYDDLVSHPVARDLALVAGLNPKEIENLPGSGSAKRWARQVLPDTTLVIRESRMGPTFEPGWVVVSRVGARQTRLRVMKDVLGLRGYEFFDDHHGHSLWVRESEGRNPMVLTLVSGLLVACVHPDPNAIRDVVDRINGRRHSMRDVRPHWIEVLSQPDQGMDTGMWFGGPFFPEPFQVEMRLDASGRVDLLVRGEQIGNWFGEDWEERNEFAALFAGPTALAVAHLPPLPALGVDRPSTVVGLGSPAFTFLGLPASLLLIPAESAEVARSQADRVMNALGRELGTRWFRRDTEKGWRYEPANDDSGQFSRGAGVPTAVWQDNLLILSMSGAGLDRLLERAGRPEAAFELRDVAWTPPEFLAWMDGTRIAREMEPALELRSLARSPGERDPEAEPEAWKPRLQALGRLKATATLESEHTLRVSFSGVTN